ncbi:MAG: TolC family protein [Acidobacteria bacterium]|nr:TolC family protein [Acidobacteriota bacterium]
MNRPTESCDRKSCLPREPTRHFSRRALWVLVVVVSAGCATYTPQPLGDPHHDPAATRETLQELVVEAGEIENPLLEPIEIRLDDGLSPDEAAVLAVVANPDLRAARAQRGVAEASILKAGLLPDPQLAASADHPVKRDPTTSTATSFGLSWDLDPFFVRGAERAAAKAASDQVSLDIAWQEWSVAQQTRTEVFSILFLERQLGLVRDEEAALEEVSDRLDRAAAQHLVDRAQALASTDALISTRSTRIDLEGQLAQARLEVARLLGVPGDQTLRLAGDVEASARTAVDLAAAAADDRSRWLDGLSERRLDLVALRAGYQSQEETVRAAILRQFPRINIGLTRARDTSAIVTLGPALSISLPSLDRNRGEIAVERATREQLRQEYSARELGAQADVMGLLEGLRQAGRALDNAKAAVPAAQQLATAYDEALRRRSADALTAYRARADLLTRELTVLQLEQELVRLGLELQMASGRYEPLAGTRPEAP